MIGIGEDKMTTFKHWFSNCLAARDHVLRHGGVPVSDDAELAHQATRYGLVWQQELEGLRLYFIREDSRRILIKLSEVTDGQVVAVQKRRVFTGEITQFAYVGDTRVPELTSTMRVLRISVGLNDDNTAVYRAAEEELYKKMMEWKKQQQDLIMHYDLVLKDLDIP